MKFLGDGHIGEIESCRGRKGKEEDKGKEKERGKFWGMFLEMNSKTVSKRLASSHGAREQEKTRRRHTRGKAKRALFRFDNYTS